MEEMKQRPLLGDPIFFFATMHFPGHKQSTEDSMYIARGLRQLELFVTNYLNSILVQQNPDNRSELGYALRRQHFSYLNEFVNVVLADRDVMDDVSSQDLPPSSHHSSGASDRSGTQLPSESEMGGTGRWENNSSIPNTNPLTTGSASWAPGQSSVSVVAASQNNGGGGGGGATPLNARNPEKALQAAIYDSKSLTELGQEFVSLWRSLHSSKPKRQSEFWSTLYTQGFERESPGLSIGHTIADDSYYCQLFRSVNGASTLGGGGASGSGGAHPANNSNSGSGEAFRSMGGGATADLVGGEPDFIRPLNSNDETIWKLLLLAKKITEKWVVIEAQLYDLRDKPFELSPSWKVKLSRDVMSSSRGVSHKLVQLVTVLAMIVLVVVLILESPLVELEGLNSSPHLWILKLAPTIVIALGWLLLSWMNQVNKAALNKLLLEYNLQTSTSLLPPHVDPNRLKPGEGGYGGIGNSLGSYQVGGVGADGGGANTSGRPPVGPGGSHPHGGVAVAGSAFSNNNNNSNATFSRQFHGAVNLPKNIPSSSSGSLQGRASGEIKLNFSALPSSMPFRVGVKALLRSVLFIAMERDVVSYWSPGAVELTGISAAEMYGKSIFTIVSEADRSTLASYLETLRLHKKAPAARLPLTLCTPVQGDVDLLVAGANATAVSQKSQPLVLIGTPPPPQATGEPLPAVHGYWQTQLRSLVLPDGGGSDTTTGIGAAAVIPTNISDTVRLGIMDKFFHKMRWVQLTHLSKGLMMSSPVKVEALLTKIMREKISFVDSVSIPHSLRELKIRCMVDDIRSALMAVVKNTVKYHHVSADLSSGGGAGHHGSPLLALPVSQVSLRIDLLNNNMLTITFEGIAWKPQRGNTHQTQQVNKAHGGGGGPSTREDILEQEVTKAGGFMMVTHSGSTNASSSTGNTPKGGKILHFLPPSTATANNGNGSSQRNNNNSSGAAVIMEADGDSSAPPALISGLHAPPAAPTMITSNNGNGPIRIVLTFPARVDSIIATAGGGGPNSNNNNNNNTSKSAVMTSHTSTLVPVGEMGDTASIGGGSSSSLVALSFGSTGDRGGGAASVSFGNNGGPPLPPSSKTVGTVLVVELDPLYRAEMNRLLTSRNKVVQEILNEAQLKAVAQHRGFEDIQTVFLDNSDLAKKVDKKVKKIPSITVVRVQNEELIYGGENGVITNGGGSDDRNSMLLKDVEESDESSGVSGGGSFFGGGGSKLGGGGARALLLGKPDRTRKLKRPFDTRELNEILKESAIMYEKHQLEKRNEVALNHTRNYEVEAWEEEGRGQYGAVYKVTLKNGGVVAMKSINATPRDKAKIVKEVKIMQQINHPNIVRYEHCESTNTEVRIFMEYCGGGTLKKYVKTSQTADPVKVSTIIKQLLLVLDHLHSQSILHLDIKPQNILFTDDGQLKVADFGTAVALWNGANNNSSGNNGGGSGLQGFGGGAETVGTPKYMAPEMLYSGTKTAAADVWSVGVVTMELLNACPKILTNNINQSLQWVRKAREQLQAERASSFGGESQNSPDDEEKVRRGNNSNNTGAGLYKDGFHAGAQQESLGVHYGNDLEKNCHFPVNMGPMETVMEGLGPDHVRFLRDARAFCLACCAFDEGKRPEVGTLLLHPFITSHPQNTVTEDQTTPAQSRTASSVGGARSSAASLVSDAIAPVFIAPQQPPQQQLISPGESPRSSIVSSVRSSSLRGGGPSNSLFASAVFAAEDTAMMMMEVDDVPPQQ